MSKSDNLYTDDNPETTVAGLGFKNKEKAIESVQKLEQFINKNKISRSHALQAAVSMEQRSKHHPHQNENMKEAEAVFRKFIEKLKS